MKLDQLEIERLAEIAFNSLSAEQNRALSWERASPLIREAWYRMIRAVFAAAPVDGSEPELERLRRLPGENAVVSVTIEGGVVQHVNAPPGVTVLIRDYDVDDEDPDTAIPDENGDGYSEWIIDGSEKTDLTPPATPDTILPDTEEWTNHEIPQE